MHAHTHDGRKDRKSGGRSFVWSLARSRLVKSLSLVGEEVNCDFAYVTVVGRADRVGGRGW